MYQSLCLVPVQSVVSVTSRPLVGQVLPPVTVSSCSVSPLNPVAFVSPLVVSKFQIEMCNHTDRADCCFGRPEARYLDWFFSLFMGAEM